MSPIEIRAKACELAANALGPELNNTNGARLMALCIFFESYISTGAKQTEQEMHMLRPRRVKHLHVIAGGEMRGAS
jgi:hypothetical protein